MNTDKIPNLKPQTVYIPVDSACPTIVIKETYGDIGARKEENQICLSKEQLIELVSDAINFGWEEFENGEVWKPNEKQFINNLF